MSAGPWTGMRGIAPVPSYVIMQPTTLCNLDCAYCYLPFRAADRRMPVPVAEAAAAPVNPWTGLGPRFSVGGHGGEPRGPRGEAPAAPRVPLPGGEDHNRTTAPLSDD